MEVVEKVAKELSQGPTKNDKCVAECERRLDLIQRKIENVSKDQSLNKISIIDASKKQETLMQNFKYT